MTGIPMNPLRWTIASGLAALLLLGGGYALRNKSVSNSARTSETPAVTLAQTGPAAQGTEGKSASDVEVLKKYDAVISDTGEKYSDWDHSPTRVAARVGSGDSYEEHYFDSLPAAYYVTHEMYGDGRPVEFRVVEYDGVRSSGFVSSGGRLIDGLNATYVWDYDHYSRGGLPLILAFSSPQEARNELRYRNGIVLDFGDLSIELSQWRTVYTRDDRIYWRGSEPERWGRDYYSDRWEHAWDQRWDGWSFDTGDGWLDLHGSGDDWTRSVSQTLDSRGKGESASALGKDNASARGKERGEGHNKETGNSKEKKKVKGKDKSKGHGKGQDTNKGHGKGHDGKDKDHGKGHGKASGQIKG